MPEQMTKQDAIETLEIFMNDYTREDSAICRAIDIAIDALRQPTIEPGVRLIDANALKAKLKIGTNTATYSDYCNGYCDARQVDLDTIDAAPTIEPKVRHGQWYDHMHTDTAVCSECGRVFTDETPYCPNCGAYMREEGAELK